MRFMDEKQNIEFDRNQAVMFAIRMASLFNKQPGFEYGIRDIPNRPDLVHLVMLLPGEGQVMWIMNRHHLVGRWPVFPHPHDGHNLDERALRLNNYLMMFG